MILRIVPSDAERTAGKLVSETIAQASRSLRTDGALIIEDVVDTALLPPKPNELLLTHISQYLEGSKHEDAARVGGRRLGPAFIFEDVAQEVLASGRVVRRISARSSASIFVRDGASSRRWTERLQSRA